MACAAVLAASLIPATTGSAASGSQINQLGAQITAAASSAYSAAYKTAAESRKAIYTAGRR